MLLQTPERARCSERTVLPRDFYARGVVQVARDLIGCRLEHAGTVGVILETEAYHQDEAACHAFVGMTPRTLTLFGAPGRAYVYLSYGIHSLFNAVCEHEGVGAAVLVRALEPIHGVELMQSRRGVLDPAALCSGPGKLTQAMGLGLSLNGSDLREGPARIHEPDGAWRARILTGTRVGITKATDLPWRFAAEGSMHVSRPRLL